MNSDGLGSDVFRKCVYCFDLTSDYFLCIRKGCTNAICVEKCEEEYFKGDESVVTCYEHGGPQIFVSPKILVYSLRLVIESQFGIQLWVKGKTHKF